MKQFVIIPMGGEGVRFKEAGYKTYKPFLKVSDDTTIIDKIISNFQTSKTEFIIIGNSKKIKLIKSKIKNKKVKILEIRFHKFGPLYSLFLVKKKIDKIIGDNNMFVVYSDINWNWNYTKVLKFVSGKKAVVFTHKDYHPDLENNFKSDFCKANENKEILKTSIKKPISKDYKNDLLAIGCYYFKNFQFFKNYFKNDKRFILNNRKEIYLISIIDYLIKKRIKVSFYNIDNFVHLGIPSQYENFIRWRSIFINEFKKSIKLNMSNLMLMAGKGKRIKELGKKKPFLKIKNTKFYTYIFKKFGCTNNFITTTKNYYKDLDKKYTIFKIKKSNSMLETLEKSLDFIKFKKNILISSCDCFGIFEKQKLLSFIKIKKPEIILFSYKFSESQKQLVNSHTAILKKKNKIFSIKVKKNNNNDLIGNAGFFWVNSTKVLNYINEFKFNTNLRRELLVDDYFEYLFRKKKFRIETFEMKNYVHIGSTSEYKELQYWENYFKNEIIKIN